MKLSYKNIIQYLLFGSFIFLIGCDDEIPFPTTYDSETVFYVNGKLDNNDLVLEAGQEDFYMYTDLELNNQNILEISGAFQKNDLCTDICEEKLKIIINNDKEGLNLQIDSTIYVGNYQLEPSIVTGNSEYSVNFTPTITGTTPVSYFWQFGDSTTSQQSNPTNTYFNNNGYLVELQVVNQNGQVSKYQNTISDFNLPSTDCSFGIDYNVFYDSIQDSYNYDVWITDPNSNPFLTGYFWLVDFGQGVYTDSSLVDSISFTTPTNVTDFNICVSKLSNTCNVLLCKDFNTNQGAPDYDLSFEYNVQNIVTPGDSTFFSMVIIEYTTPGGVFYSSQLGNQTNSTFEILSIFNHDNNERGQTTSKIEATVNCKLYNQDGSSLDFISDELVFGISTSQ
jgi:hypothetical protein